jgi:hypothetical protein
MIPIGKKIAPANRNPHEPCIKHVIICVNQANDNDSNNTTIKTQYAISIMSLLFIF